MTTEEKARAYDEALEKAKARYDKEPIDGYVGYANQILKELFPELAENEDERMIKFFRAIASMPVVGEYFEKCDIAYHDALAWLEKQKEQKPVDDTAFEKWLDDWYQGSKEAGGDVVMSEAEFKNWSRGIRNMYQQKPADLSDMMVHKEPYIAPVPTPMVADEQKPAEWSEEDEKMKERLITRLNWITHNTRTDGTSPNITFFDEIDWLKSLKPSEQKYTLADLEAEWKHGYDFAKKEAETAYTGDEDKADL